MLSPPITGNEDLDTYLFDLHNQALETGASASGMIVPSDGNPIVYTYQYIHVKYGNDNVGSGFSDLPTNKSYYGILNDSLLTESTNPADYTWYKAAQNFGTTYFLYYQTIGGRQIKFSISTVSPGVGWFQDSNTPIDLDQVTSSTSLSSAFSTYFSPGSLQVPTTGGVPSFTNVVMRLYGTASNAAVPFVTAQSDSDASFVANSWRIGNSSTTGNADISYTNITVGSPALVSGIAQWPIPTAMPNSPAIVIVPVRYKNVYGVVTQSGSAIQQLIFSSSGTDGQKAATAYLYQWTTVAIPNNPTGTSTFTWSSLINSGYTGVDGWSTTLTANPGTPGVKLWVVTKQIIATAGVTSTTVDYSTGITKREAEYADGIKTATVRAYRWEATIPTISGSSVYTWSTNLYTPNAGGGWTSTISSPPSVGYTLYEATVELTEPFTTATSNVNWTTALISPISYSGNNNSSGLSGNRTAILDMYIWSLSQPTLFPSGTSNYTWSTGEFTDPTLNGWSRTPGSPTAGYTLWICRQIYADFDTTPTTLVTSVTWNTKTAVATKAATTGTRCAVMEVYQWGLTPPTTFPVGTSTYTWSTGSFTNPATLNGWSRIAPAPIAGQNLYVCSTIYNDSLTTSTTVITWNATVASVINFGNSAGSSSRISYSRISGNPQPVAGFVTTTGNSSFPPAGSWGLSSSFLWYDTDPNTASTNSLYQTDGIFDPNTNNTVWSTPYISSLKVGNLSAITVNTGALTVQDTLTMSTAGKIIGGQTDYNTGTGYFLGYNTTGTSAYKFSIGSIKSGTADVITNTITCAGHGYALYSQLVFTSIGSITNISTTKVYSVINVTTDTFQISQFYPGSALDLTGTTSTVTFTTQSMYWNGSVLNINGNLLGGTIGLGSGNSIGGYAFAVTAGGVVSCDNLFGGISLFDNSGSAGSNAVYGVTWNTQVGMMGVVAGGNATGAHGIRGINNNIGTAGLIGAGNGYDFYADGSGTNYGPFTGNHDFLIPVGQTLTPGDLVVDVTCIARNGWSNAIFQVEKSSQPNQTGVRGIFIGELRPLSTVQPTVFIDHWEEQKNNSVAVMTAQYEEIKDNYLIGSMSSLGEGQMQVCGENGNIAIDTLLVSSSIAGIAMAQSDDIIRGKTIAKAREPIVFNSPTEIKTVACIYISG